MASHQLAIAKASFSAGLLRPDPTSLTREDIARFHTLLNSAIIQCTPRNVQNCKRWILEYIAQSTARFTSLGKYLTALSASFTGNGLNLDSTSKREPSAKRKRLHMLYLVNDVLHHTKFQVNDASICGKVQPILVNLVGSAASFTGCPKHQGKIQDLLELWDEKGYYSKDYIEKLREAIKIAAEAGKFEGGSATQNADQDAAGKSTKSAPYVMPAMHGDQSTPWFDLPAGNLMPHIEPNSTRPINPDLIKPLRFVAGPADEVLAMAVKNLLDDVQTIYGEAEQDLKNDWDIDELGQPIILDEITGDVLEGEGYYGWSRSFCEKMKRRRIGLDKPDKDRGRSRSRSRSSSRNRKRRRHSQSDDGSSQSDYRRRREYSSSRSRSPDRRHPLNGLSRSPSRSRSPPRSFSPRRAEPLQNNGGPRPIPDGLPPKPPMPLPFPVPFQGFNGNFPPPPPPFPPTHLGQPNFHPSQNWPPPPPPPYPQFQPQQPGYPSYPQFQPQQAGYQAGPGNYAPNGATGWQQQQMPHGNGNYQQENGRGYNNNGWNNAPGGQQGRGRGNYRARGW